MTAVESDSFQDTQYRRLEQYRDRWTSYGVNSGILNISEKLTAEQLKKYDIFKDYPDKFLEKISADVSVATWKFGSVLFEEGSYIDLAFVIIDGAVEVNLQKLEDEVSHNTPIFDRHRTMVSMPKGAGADDDSGSRATLYQTQIKRQETRKTHEGLFLATMDIDLPLGDKLVLGPGDVFGEIGALSGWPQSVTARTASDCELIQIRVPALRLMKRKSKGKGLEKRLDELYRKRSLFFHLKQTPFLHACSNEFIKSLTQKVELVSCEPGEMVAREGDKVDALYLIRSGFVRLSQQLLEEDMVVSYLSKGMTFGEVGLLLEGNENWYFTVSSVEYSELVKISRKDFAQILDDYPEIEKPLWQSVVQRIKEAGYIRKNINQSEFIDTALNSGLVQGNSILVIDLNRCTRCDDCVRGCAETHGGQPRFIREGDKYENFLITRACYHCRDPVCLIGCPTGAIHRTNVGDVVAIDERLCIGCQNCAHACPYDAITMHDTGEVWPDNAIPEGYRGKERLLATKCDLCYQSSTGPACVNNCPHGCAYRVETLDEFNHLLAKHQ